MDDGAWDIEPGRRMTRDERRERFGGAIQGGIQPSAQTPNVFIYSDPVQGELYGYNFDGWDLSGKVFTYTGEGRVGDQVMKSGNRAILDHQEQGRALRVFVADGTVPGTKTKLHRYLGEFVVDSELPYVTETAPDVNGDDRAVAVFRLRPVGDYEFVNADRGAMGDTSDQPLAEQVDPESHESPEFEQSGTEATTARRRESDLVKRYEAFLEGQDHVVKRWKVRANHQLRWMFTDTYDVTSDELTEAKGATSRGHIREAIGQLFDYRRFIEPRPANLAVLTPTRPSRDLIDLLHDLEIVVIFESDTGEFERLEPGT